MWRAMLLIEEEVEEEKEQEEALHNFYNIQQVTHCTISNIIISKQYEKIIKN